MPPIIQGGMGIYAFPWFAARLVSLLGQVGGTSGTGLHLVVPRILQLGDPGGHYRRALAAFPDQEMARRVLDRYFVAEGISPSTRFQNIERYSLTPSRDLIELTICANFCEVWLAKEGHDGLIGINYLEKVQLPHLYALYGALLAGVDYLFMGAGIPMQISGVLDKLIRHEPATYAIYVIGAEASSGFRTEFTPRDFIRRPLPELERPLFYPIISSAAIPLMMVRSEKPKIEGWIAETKSAGGHSARPRGKVTLTDSGEPCYGERDEIDFGPLVRIGLPFYLAGSFASPEKLAYARSVGASGIQAGSIFALADESNIDASLRRDIRKRGYSGDLVVFNDPAASPTGFPFKVVQLPGTLGCKTTYANRRRICDIGGLLQPCLRDRTVEYRCPAEPVEHYRRKGGSEADTANTMCLCNGLFSTARLGQRLADGTLEPPVVTLGQDLSFLRHLMADENDGYTIADAIQYLLTGSPQ